MGVVWRENYFRRRREGIMKDDWSLLGWVVVERVGKSRWAVEVVV
jgi:hypothetical protein